MAPVLGLHNIRSSAHVLHAVRLFPSRQWRRSICSAQRSAENGQSWLLTKQALDVAKPCGIIVLAGGLTGTGGVPLVGKRRLDVASELHHHHGSDIPILCSGGGTPHVPAVLGPTGHVIHESTAYAHYLATERGVPASCILKETSSYDTIGNAYFSIKTHVLPAGWRTVLVVTSEFHMPRSRAIFEALGPLEGTAEPEWHFVSASDDGLFLDEVMQARHQREAQSLSVWKQNAAKLQGSRQVHEWLFSTHLCYAASRQDEFGKRDASRISDKALGSY